jgi:hypothetical protein
MAVNRERKKIEREVSSFDIEYMSVDHVIEAMISFKKQYGGNARFLEERHAYSDGHYIALCVEVFETDEEMAKRIALEERWAAEDAERDRKEFERLKAKFGN